MEGTRGDAPRTGFGRIGSGMLQKRQPRSGWAIGFGLLELIFHSAVRSVRKSHRNALVGLFMNMAQTLLLVLVFYVMFGVFNLRGAAIRGDFLLYIMSGIFLFMCHIKAIGAVVHAEGSGSPIMKHAPMNTLISVIAAAIGALYIQILSLVVVLFIYHVAITPITIHNPAGAMGLVLLAWFSGVGIGMVFLAIKPWWPGFTELGSQIYMRANMIASGKMFVANALPAFMLPYFDWNPLFHAIDQARGHVFIDYVPMQTSASYALYVALVGLVIGLMGEFYTRQRASISWQAKR